MTATTALPPIPAPGPADAPFWEATKRGVLTVQRCTGCGWLAYPPSTVCTNCLLDPPSFEWAPISGDATLATWTIVRDAFLPGFRDLTPYVVGEVEIPEQSGLRIAGRLVGIDTENLRIGLELHVDFVDGGEATRVPVFRAVTP